MQTSMLILIVGIFLMSCEKHPEDTSYRSIDPPYITDDQLSLTEANDKSPENFRIAFLGDSGKSQGFRKTLSLIDRMNTNLVIHLGDLAYSELDRKSARKWNAEIDSVLGPSFPYLFVIGNHDRWHWSGSKGYRSILKKRVGNLPANSCFTPKGDKDLGIKTHCRIPGFLLLLSGIGTKDGGHETFIENSLRRHQKAPWKICAWHKNQRDMQVGRKSDEIGWKAYQLCAQYGAMIATGHEHSYSRTRTLSDIGNRAANHGAIGRNDQLQLAPGKTFAFVSGLGGKSARPYDCALHDNERWWASIYASNYILSNGMTVEAKRCELKDNTQGQHRTGVLFVDYNYDGNPKLAKGQFISSEGEIMDEFWINR